MSRYSYGLDDATGEYLAAHSEPATDVQEALIARTTELGPWAGMQIGRLQGAFMDVLLGALRPSFAVEVGTFTGYSSIVIAKNLAPGGKLLCCDVSEEWTSIAREHWEAAGVADRIELVIAPGAETLSKLGDQVVDFAFIDADKTGYRDYYEALVPRLSPSGIIAVDNTIWSGKVVTDEDTGDDTVALRAFNDHVAADERTVCALTPIGDGVTLIRRR